MDERWLIPLRKVQMESSAGKKIKETSVFFQLLVEEGGVSLRVVNSEGNEVFPDYYLFEGHTRQLLQTLENIQQRNDFTIQWDTSSQYTRINEHPYLMALIRLCTNLVDAKMKPIVFDRTAGKVRLELSNTGENEILTKPVA